MLRNIHQCVICLHAGTCYKMDLALSSPSWSELPNSMPSPGRFFAMEAVGNKLYAIGGLSAGDDYNLVYELSSVLIFELIFLTETCL